MTVTIPLEQKPKHLPKFERKYCMIQYKKQLVMYQVTWGSKKNISTIYFVISSFHLFGLIMLVNIVFCR